jgi:putative copper export protein
MDAAVKACLYLGTLGLLGPGVYQQFVASTSERRYRWVIVGGFLLVVVGSVLNLSLTVMNVLGRFDANFIWQYANSTRHGSMTYLRLGLALVICVIALTPRWRGKGIVFNLAALGFFASFAALSHAVSMRGNVALVFDLIHMTAATLWVSAVVFSALSRATPQSLQRVSGIGLGSVVLLIGTGLYATLLHVNTFALLVGSSYGRVLLLKLILFTVILLLAALNRWYFLPRLLVRETNFRRILFVEASLLVSVLLVTGLLTMTAPPNM